MKTITSLVLVAAFGLLASCTINPHSMDMTQAVQSAKTRSDHDALAKHYEDAAKEMRAKAEEHKKMLAQYRGKKESLWQARSKSDEPLPRIDSHLRAGRSREHERWLNLIVKWRRKRSKAGHVARSIALSCNRDRTELTLKNRRFRLRPVNMACGYKIVPLVLLALYALCSVCPESISSSGDEAANSRGERASRLQQRQQA